MSETRKILLIGAGGHCISVLDSLLATSIYEHIGIVGKVEETDNAILSIMGIPIIGNDDDLGRLYAEGYTDAFIAIGSIGDVSLRKKLYQIVKNIGFTIPNIIDNTSVISKHVKLGEGIYVGKEAVVNAFVTIGNCAIVNTSSVIEHECTIGDFVHIATGAILCGNVLIDENTHIGAGSTIKQGIHIGSNSLIGMGSVVLRDIGANKKAYGNPCREVNHE
jgi:sugar O-acyltransferase (sialic acid O-acetyltransferase NeuD family)